MARKGRKLSLVAAKEKKPSVTVKAGQEFRVTAVTLQGPEVAKLKKAAARLCGGTSTCIALVDIGS